MIVCARAWRLLVGLVVGLALLLAGSGAVRADTATLSNVYLVGPGGVGGSVTWGITSASSQAVGTSGSTNYWVIQSFHPIAGLFSGFSLSFSPNAGTPTGTMTWSLVSDHHGLPLTVLQTGTFTPVPNTINTVAFTPSIYVTNDLYWLSFASTTTQLTSNYWNLKISTNGEFTGGHLGYGYNATAYTIDNTYALLGSMTTVTGAAPANLLNDLIEQSIILNDPAIFSGFKLNLRKYNAPTGTLTLTIERDLGDQRSGVLADPAATVNLAESTLTSSFALTDFVFASNISLQPGKYWLVLTTDRSDSTNYVAWQSAEFCPADGSAVKVHTLGIWAPLAETVIYSPDVISIAAPATPDPSVDSYVTMPGGSAARARAEFTAGDGAISVILLAVVALLAFGTFHVIRKK